MWQIQVVITGIISALAQGIGKRQVARMSAFQSGLIRDMATWGMVWGFYLVQGDVRLEWPSVVFVALGVAESVAMAAYYSAQREQMAATAVFSYPFSQLLIILLAGIFFREWQYFDLRTGLGLINTVAVVGLVGLMGIFQPGDKRATKKSIWSIKLIL